LAQKQDNTSPEPADERAGLLRALLPERQTLRRLIRRFVRISADAEDVVQDAYLKLLEKPVAPREGKWVPGYLFVVARNLANDVGRRSAGESRRASALRVITTQLSNTEPGVDELVFVEQASERLRAALWELPQRTREAFLLHRIEGYSHTQVAAQLGVTTRTVERDVAAALNHLKKALFTSEEST